MNYCQKKKRILNFWDTFTCIFTNSWHTSLHLQDRKRSHAFLFEKFSSGEHDIRQIGVSQAIWRVANITFSMCVVYDSNLLIWNEVIRCHIFLVVLMVCLTTIQSCTRLFCSLSRICIICEDDIKLGQDSWGFHIFIHYPLLERVQ